MKNFWRELSHPFSVLAPMEDVTDFVFREIVATVLPRPSVFFTEFTSSDGLNSRGRPKLLEKFKYSELQRPIVAQIWGVKPQNIFLAAKTVSDLGFDGVDINMGCPVINVIKRGAGAGHIEDPKLASEIIQAAKSGARNIPVSVKTRLGLGKIDTDNWISFLLKQDIAALTVHGRIAKEMSKKPANWEEIGKAVKLRDQISPTTILVGNGDIKNMPEVQDMYTKYGVDGVMIARGILNNPWAFELNPKDHTAYESIQILKKHLQLYEETYKNVKRYDWMKKFYKVYIKDFEGASEMRQKMMLTKNINEAYQLIDNTNLV